MIKYGDTDLESGDFVKDGTEEYGSEDTQEEIVAGEGQETQEESTEDELDQETLDEFKDASKEDFIRAIKKYKDQAKKAYEKSELYRDLYTGVSAKFPRENQQRHSFKRPAEAEEDDEEFNDLAKKGDVKEVVDSALERERVARRNEYIQSETYIFAKQHPDFYERLSAIDKYAANDVGLQRLIEDHPRPWEYVYELAEKLELVKPQAKKPAVKTDIQRIKENAQKPKPITGIKSGAVPIKPIKDMTDKEFAEYSARLRDEM